jgi:hypothetical protein
MKLCRLSEKSKEQTYKTFAYKQNKLQAKKFAAIPFNKRIVFAPHCMRNTAACTAVEKDSYYICAECGSCKISKISKLIRELNYTALYVVKGGRTIEQIIKEQKPKAIVGIACFFEGDQALKMLKEENVTVQFIPLTEDGCAATDVDLTEVVRVLKYQDKMHEKCFTTKDNSSSSHTPPMPCVSDTRHCHPFQRKGITLPRPTRGQGKRNSENARGFTSERLSQVHP